MTRAAALISFGIALAFAGARADAMPVFAKAYGLQCSTCHTVVPALNAYGRYVQRTGYSSLNRDVLKTVTPFWVGEQANGDSTGGVSAVSATRTTSFGNIAIHGAGYFAPDWTFHVQQWLLANDVTGGGLDTAWVTYNNLFHRDGHLFIGKYEMPAPSPFSQWFDVSAFSTPEIAVGEHAYQLDGNRWGSKFAYVRGALDAEVGWGASANDLVSANDFATSPGTEKTLQWKVASAQGDQPLEIGAYGSTGSYIVSTGNVDRYTSFAPYVERDPAGGIPGLLGIYQFANDSNPGLDGSGNQLPSARSRALTLEVYQPLFSNGAMLGLRNEYTDDGLGTRLHSQVVDFAFNVPHNPYLHGYLEAGMGANTTTATGGPTWRWLIWWTSPLQK